MEWEGTIGDDRHWHSIVDENGLHWIGRYHLPDFSDHRQLLRWSLKFEDGDDYVGRIDLPMPNPVRMGAFFGTHPSLRKEGTFTSSRLICTA